MNTTTQDGKVTVFFESKNWSCGASSVWMALVPDTEMSFASNAPKDNYVVTGENGTYDVSIPASSLKADTTYNVWVKFGDGPDWHKSNATYTHSTTGK